MTKMSDNHYTIQVVAHALKLLEQFGRNSEELSAKEISHALKLSKQSTFRLLTTLESRGYIERTPATDRYQLGLKTFELRQNYLRQSGILSRALPFLENLLTATGETTYLVFLDNTHIVYVAAKESSQPVHVASRRGTRLPAYCTASGKALLACLSEAELDHLFPEGTMQSFTDRTSTSMTTLKKELQQVIRQGYAVDDEEYDREICCVAAPVWDTTGKTVGALSISGPAFRMGYDRIENELAPLILQSCTELSKHLGFHGEA